MLFLRDTYGQGLMEYLIIIVIVVLVVAGAALTVHESLGSKLLEYNDAL